MSTPVLRLEGVSVGYGGAPVVRDVDLTVSPGEFVVLLGENGSGKSTLVRGLLGLAPAVTGTIELFGRKATALERRRVGYVPQRTTVAGGVPTSVREVVASGRVAQRRWFTPTRTKDRSAVDAALASVRLADRAADPLAQLSGGQQRRTLIARALAGDPELLVMDEPMAGVDATNVELFAHVVQRWKESGLTLLMVAHGTGPLRALVDRAVIMRRGVVVYDGELAGDIVAEYDDHVVEDHLDAEPLRLGAPDEPKLA
ncbi:MAG: ABC transporter ATP-binding protein [Actinomycetes bacterium]